jgi:hypothetical protein
MDPVVRGDSDANNLHLGTAAGVSISKKFQSGFIPLPCEFLGSVLTSPSFQAYTGAHHQWAHGGEILFAVAFTFPFLKLSKYAMWVFFIALNLAMWTNGMAYVVAALSGDHWLGSLNTSRDGTPRKWTMWSNISMFLAPTLCGAAYLICFSIMVVGLWRNSEAEDGKSDDKTYEKEGKHTKNGEGEREKKKD